MRAARVLGLHRDLDYRFPAKKLVSFDLQAAGQDHRPFKIFLSQVDLEAFPVEVAALVREDCAEQAEAVDHRSFVALIEEAERSGGLAPVKAEAFVQHFVHKLMHRNGPPMKRSTLDAVARVSGEAASALALGPDFNHVTIDVRAAGFAGIEPMAAEMLRRGRGFPLWWVALPATTNALCWAVLPAVGIALNAPWPYEIMLFNFLYTFFFLAIPPPVAAAIGGVAALTYAVLQGIFAPHDWALFSKVFIVSGFVLHGVAAAALLERNERRSWLARRRLSELARRDSLTGLFNRRTFFERADLALRQARRSGAAVALLLIDADHFKKFNDTHGHPAGDACLRRLAGVLARFAQRPLDVVARIGGEEFALLFFDAPQAWAMTRTEELRDAVRALDTEGIPCTTVSIGIATDHGGANLTTLLQRADTALYRAKAAGRDRVSE